MAKSGRSQVPDRLPNYVRDVDTATCVFCPFGAEVEPGDRLHIYDEKTVFGRQQRERLVEITAVKIFRSNGRVITLDLTMITPQEIMHIAHDSEQSVEALLEHHTGASTYDGKHPPVVVYFQPCNEDDTTGSRTRPGAVAGFDNPPPHSESRWQRLTARLTAKHDSEED